VTVGQHGVVVVATRSGAPAMLDRELGEVMHPVVGPLVESDRLYIGPSRLAARLSEANPARLVLFDVGLGAGSNASLAWKTAVSLPATTRRIEIVSFDRRLDALRLASDPAHAPAFGLDGRAASAVRDLLETGRHEQAGHIWRLVLGELPDVLEGEPAHGADIVFWDPFSPRANPQLWTVRAFRALWRACRVGATVHTYSGATATRTALLLGGFAVGFGEPTGDKAQTTTAAVDARDLLRPLDQRWLQRLARSSAPLPSDAPPDALGLIPSLPQFSA
jgi:queuine tRNA-ribosyltransferase